MALHPRRKIITTAVRTSYLNMAFLEQLNNYQLARKTCTIGLSTNDEFGWERPWPVSITVSKICEERIDKSQEIFENSSADSATGMCFNQTV
jgi:hypothetical protein